MGRLGAHWLGGVMRGGKARGAKGVGQQRWIGSTGNGRNPIINGRRPPSRGGTSRMMREYHVRMCVQERLACSAGDKPAGAKVRSPVVRIAGGRETKTLNPIDKVSLLDDYKPPGLNESNPYIALAWY